MSEARVNPGSFRDPGSRVYESGERIFRVVTASGAPAYEAARDSGLLSSLIDRHFLVSSAEVDRSTVPLAEPAAYLLEHDRIPFVSHPYEWPFSLLKRAALHHLDLHLHALENGFTLSDATAYNIQFLGTRPIGIDHLSLRPYLDGEIWAAHRQFCMQFLNPLIFWSRKGVSPNSWFRGSLEGIPPEDLAPLLSLRDNLSWTVISHVTGQATLQKRAIRASTPSPSRSKPKLSAMAFRGMLEGLRGYIDKCRISDQTTIWHDYSSQNSYGEGEAAAKRSFVARMVEAVQPRQLLDMGCNSGDYTEVALGAGAKNVVGFDFDYGALERSVARADASNMPFLPLWIDAANPSPSQGWAQAERGGFTQRLNADAIIALAFVHHIAIGRNVPLDMVIEWLISLAPVGVIEFPPKSDPMVQILLSNREDIFPNYSEGAFIDSVMGRARIIDSAHLSPNGRMLVWYDRSES